MRADLFAGFDGRDDALDSIDRYPDWPTMFYRTTDRLHSQRVSWIVEDLADAITEVYGGRVDIEQARVLALVHDDYETDPRLGDVPLWLKLRMGDIERAELDLRELAAIDLVTGRWPERVNGFAYRDLLLQAHGKTTLEAQIVSLADKTDALCEAIHEFLAGNELFNRPIGTYRSILASFPMRFPALAPLFATEHPFTLAVPYLFSPERVRPHTYHSVAAPTGIPQYDRWKQLTIGHTGFSPLVKPKEC